MLNDSESFSIYIASNYYLGTFKLNERLLAYMTQPKEVKQSNNKMNEIFGLIYMIFGNGEQCMGIVNSAIDD